MWEQMLILLIGFLAQFVMSFFNNLKKAGMDDESLSNVITEIVNTIERDHPDWSSDTKWDYAFDAVAQYGVNAGRTLKKSLVNTLIELAVQDMKAKKGVEADKP